MVLDFIPLQSPGWLVHQQLPRNNGKEREDHKENTKIYFGYVSTAWIAFMNSLTAETNDRRPE